MTAKDWVGVAAAIPRLTTMGKSVPTLYRSRQHPGHPGAGMRPSEVVGRVRPLNDG